MRLVLPMRFVLVLVTTLITVTGILTIQYVVAHAQTSASLDATVTFYGCVNNVTGELNIVNASTKCPTGTHKIHWNQQGPAGPAGPQGLPGPQGPQGPQGPSGVANVQTLTSPPASLPPFSFNAADVVCPGGTRLISGGFQVSPNNTGSFSVTEDGPTGNPNTWHVGAVNNDTKQSDPAISFVAFAICVS